MNREIKIRVLQRDCIDEEEFRWEYFLLPEDIREEQYNSDYAHQWETMSEYTGLKDKNGREIYEGDILDYIEINGTITLGVVEYVLGGFCVRQVGAEGMYIDLRDKPLESRIIGNIYENRELLENQS